MSSARHRVALASGTCRSLAACFFAAACSTTSDLDVTFELGELDTGGSVLVENPEILAIGEGRIAVRIVTIGSECAHRSGTLVSRSNGETVLEPMVEVPSRCSSRLAKLFEHDVVITGSMPGPHDVVVGTAGEGGEPVVTRRRVEVW